MNRTKQTHTPGPWEWRYVQETTGKMRGCIAMLLETTHRPIPLNDPLVLAVREDWIRSLDGHPDARLIAEAPAMLEALQDLRNWNEVMGGWESPCWDRLAAILARIEGGEDA